MKFYWYNYLVYICFISLSLLSTNIARFWSCVLTTEIYSIIVNMFNSSILVNFIFILFYTFNLILFTFFVVRYLKKSQSKINKTNPFWLYTNKVILMLFVIILAGLPPVSLFFFKIFIVLNAQNVLLSTLLLCLVNTFILYYYVNFLTSVLWNKTTVLNFNKFQLYFRSYSKQIRIPSFNTLFFFCVFTNFYFVFFWEFLLNLFSII